MRRNYSEHVRRLIYEMELRNYSANIRTYSDTHRAAISNQRILNHKDHQALDAWCSSVRKTR